MPRHSKISSSTPCIEQQWDSRSTDPLEDQGLFYDDPYPIYAYLESFHEHGIGIYNMQAGLYLKTNLYSCTLSTSSIS